MTEDRWQTVKELFHAAAELPAPERDALLRERCGNDAELLREAWALLASHREDAANDVSDAAPDTGALTAKAAARLHGLGRSVGPYKLLRVLGEGGMGVVYLAEQYHPIRRAVALKLIKLGMDTGSVIARFEAERQALAMMAHPNIAKVLDAGATEEGRPYFVMELVTGEPITAYCDKNQFSLRQRLELFAEVCGAVEHAHASGIIHRDLKPTNVLVSTQDDRPHATVIDFGIAKATSGRLTEKTLLTECSALLGTPEYMSPEQTDPALDVDARTDVYSLGIMLYELLTGQMPYEARMLRSLPPAEVGRVIRGFEPPIPSARVSRLIERSGEARHTRARTPCAALRGELDWIVMKAIEKDPGRRYETAHLFADDVKRYLQREGIAAAPPSVIYEFRKLVKRHRRILTVTCLLAIGAIIGIAVLISWQIYLFLSGVTH